MDLRDEMRAATNSSSQSKIDPNRKNEESPIVDHSQSKKKINHNKKNEESKKTEPNRKKNEKSQKTDPNRKSEESKKTEPNRKNEESKKINPNRKNEDSAKEEDESTVFLKRLAKYKAKNAVHLRRRNNSGESIYAGLPPAGGKEDFADDLRETECRYLEITTKNGKKFYLSGLLAEHSPYVKLLMPLNGIKKLSLKLHHYEEVRSFCEIWYYENQKDFKGLFEYLETNYHKVCLKKMLSLSYYLETRNVQDSLMIAEDARTKKFTIEEMIKARVPPTPVIVDSSDSSESSPLVESSPDSVYKEVVYDIDYSNDNWLYKHLPEAAQSLADPGSTETPVKDTKVKETVTSPSDLHATGINDSGSTEATLKDMEVKEIAAALPDLHATGINDSGSIGTPGKDTKVKETEAFPLDLYATGRKLSVIVEEEALTSALSQLWIASTEEASRVQTGG